MSLKSKTRMNCYPDIFALREWDIALLKRYRPIFCKLDKTCHLCALGPCKPYKENRGKCGIDETGFKAREGLLDAVIGASGHASHAVSLLEDLLAKFGEDSPVDAGPHNVIPTPVTTLITGCRPKKLGEFKNILAYIQRQLMHLLSSVSFGTEAAPEDFVSKALHAGMLDNLAMEIADIAQISAMNMPKGESNSPIVAIGLETVDTSKPVLLIIGHNSTVAHEIMHLVEGRSLKDKVEVCGLCCAASDGARHNHAFKIIGNQASQLEVIQSGIADVVILDTQCIRADAVLEARKVDSIVIATTQETALGFKDLTEMQLDEAVEYVLENGNGIVLDKKAAAEMAVNIAVRSQESGVRIKTTSRTPHPASGFLRVGRGLIRDSEIRGVAPSIVMGEIPGIVGIFGCPEEKGKGQGSRGKGQEAQKLAEEFLKRGYIVSTGGCASMDLASGDLFKNNPDFFDSGNLTNLGSCVSASHLIGACIKIAHIMCHRKLENNYQEIADYIINRVGAVVILWGAFTQKAFSSALGMARFGIPVIFGPKFKNYGLHLLGRDGEWLVKDKRLGDEVLAGPEPQNLLCVAETAEEALLLAAKLCMRPNDTSQGRKAKLKNYIELYKNTRRIIPPDINLFVRTHYDIPEGVEQEVSQSLKGAGWKRTFIPDPTLL
ncbi:MAG: hypothetical protein HY266_01735 [Deltaproteobacteria bacterium]|nr:hypothetical protein [Deltaproteobacteria bacterium]